MKIRIVKNKLTEVDKFDKIVDTRPPPKAKTKEQALDTLQNALFVAGFIPGYGNLADILNMFIYAGRGDYVSAAIMLMAAMPVFGVTFAPAARALKSGKGQKYAFNLLKQTAKTTLFNPRWCMETARKSSIWFKDVKRIRGFVNFAWKYSKDARFTREAYRFYLSADIYFQGILMSGIAATITLQEFANVLKQEWESAQAQVEATEEENIKNLNVDPVIINALLDDLKSDSRSAGPSEEDLYKALGMPKE